MKYPFDPYKKKFSENKLWKKITVQVKKIGMKTVYMALLLFYAYKRKDTPLWAKNIVLGTLGYFISPIDIIPDLTPFLGYTDDAGMLALGLVIISSYIDQDVKTNAREKLRSWFGDENNDELDEIDEEYS